MTDLQTESFRTDTETSLTQHLRPASKVALIIVAILAGLAVALSVDMAIESARVHAGGTGSLPLCPETETVDCGEVLATQYSTWMGIVPLAGAGLATYALLLGACLSIALAGSRIARHTLWGVALALAALGTLSGLWLVIVQAFFIEKFCLLCDIVHACGLISLILLVKYRPAGMSARLPLGAGGVALAGTLVLVVGQLIYQPPVEAKDVVVKRPPTTQQAAQPSQASASASPAGVATAQATDETAETPAGQPDAAPTTQPANALRLEDSQGTLIATLDMDKALVLGDPAAERTIVEFMDYGCHECKNEAEYFKQILAEYPHWFRLVLLLSPGNRDCNEHTSRRRPEVCEIARAALAIHKYRPEEFPRAHETFFKFQSMPLTGSMAWQFVKVLTGVDDATLQQWQDDPSIDEQLKRHVDVVYTVMDTLDARGLPTLFADGKVITGAAVTVDSLKEHVTRLIGPPPGSSSL